MHHSLIVKCQEARDTVAAHRHLSFDPATPLCHKYSVPSWTDSEAASATPQEPSRCFPCSHKTRWQWLPGTHLCTHSNSTGPSVPAQPPPRAGRWSSGHLCTLFTALLEGPLHTRPQGCSASESPRPDPEAFLRDATCPSPCPLLTPTLRSRLLSEYSAWDSNLADLFLIFKLTEMENTTNKKHQEFFYNSSIILKSVDST